MHWKTVSRLIFALTMIAIGLMGIGGGFAPIWAGVPKSLPDRQLLAYGCAFVALATGAGLLAKRTAAPAALVLFLYLLLWTIAFKVPFIVRNPLVEVSYQTCGENAVLIAAAWVLYVWSTEGRAFANVPFLSGARALRLAHILYGLALLAFGFSHFAYLNLTAPLVPAWLPGHTFWAYFTGALYLATGVTLVTGIYARLGALLAAVQITLITVLVWGPMVLAGNISASDWQETVVSWALTAGALVLAASFDAYPWFDRFGRRPVRAES